MMNSATAGCFCCAFIVTMCVLYVYVVTNRRRHLERYNEPTWNVHDTAAQWVRIQIGGMGIVEDALDGIWKNVKETHVWKHMFSQIRGGQIFVEADGASRNTLRINTQNHYAVYLMGYDRYLEQHANSLIESGAPMDEVDELLESMAPRGTLMNVSSQDTFRMPSLFAVLSNCVRMKRGDDEERLLKEIDAKNTSIQRMQTDTDAEIKGNWSSAFDRVKAQRSKHSDLLKNIDSNTRSKIDGLNTFISNGQMDMSRLLKQQAELESDLKEAGALAQSATLQTFENRSSLRAAELNVDTLTRRLKTVNSMITNIKNKSVRDGRSHDRRMRRLRGDLTSVERDNTSMKNIVSMSDSRLSELDLRRQGLVDDLASTSTERMRTQRGLDDYTLRAATLNASLRTVRDALNSLPKLDTKASILARSKLESELQLVNNETAFLTEAIKDRTGKIIANETRHDMLLPRNKDLEDQIAAFNLLNGKDVTKDLNDMITENDSLRTQLSRMTLDPASYIAVCKRNQS